MDDREGRKGLLSFKSRFAAKLEQMKDGNFGTNDVCEEASLVKGQPSLLPLCLKKKCRYSLSQKKLAVESAGEEEEEKEEGEGKIEKAAAAATVISGMEEEKENDTKGKLADRKQSKQVKEMQERLKKMKEAEERKKKDEEERLRKEEEEQLWIKN
ncbi:hypothetical protein HAX54_042625 [Datura stramonium]|uniref:Uncharacterized protein n=1 Tax=Datura stramonium TaxID=4076 RepID=A0ABS8RNV4_DATST|nr:hypothetical protein [Datura stramonium]